MRHTGWWPGALRRLCETSFCLYVAAQRVATAFTMAGEEATGQFVDAPADENAADGAAKDVASIMDAKVHARPAVGQRPQNH